MKITGVQTLAIPEIKVIRYKRFCDARGYFTEHYRKSEFQENQDVHFMRNVEFRQANESFSRRGTVRGLHFQWNPYMGKLVRVLTGRLVDLVLDIRKGAPTFGQLIACDLPARPQEDYGEWIWVPPGFAHGILIPEDTTIEYLCSGEWSPDCEVGISPLAPDIDWSLCEPALHKLFLETTTRPLLITDRDRDGFTVSSWQRDARSENFVYGRGM